MKRFLIALVVGLVGLAAAAPAGAQDSSDIYVLHGIPGVTVDVYVNGELALESFAPEEIAGPLSLPAGDYEIQIFAEGADPEADEAVIETSVPVPGGANASAIAHLDAEGNPTLGVFVNDLSDPGAGNGRVAIRHTAAAPEVDIVAAGEAVPGLTGISNGSEAVAEVPAGDYPTGIAAAGTTDVIFDAPVTVVEGAMLAVYAIGDLEGGSFTLLTQSFDGLAMAGDDAAEEGAAAEGDEAEGDDAAAEGDEAEGDDAAAEGEDAAAGDEAPTAISAGNSGLAAEGDESGTALGAVLAIAAAGAVALLAVPAIRSARARR